MLTARDEAESRITGLEIGADDYVAKPFEPRELSLRIANILKRAAPPPQAARSRTVAFGPFVFHLGRGELRQGDEVIHLTDREREMLRVLAATPGETVPRMALAGNGGRQRARRRRAGQPAAPQDRARSRQSAVRADRARHRLPAGGLAMTHARRSTDDARSIRPRRCPHGVAARLGGQWLDGQRVQELMPKGLYARALLIIIVPMVILQSVVAFVFMERHWNTVTRRLSAAVVQDIAALIEVYKAYPQDKRPRRSSAASRRSGSAWWSISCPPADMPPPGPKPFFSLLDQALSVRDPPADRPAVLDRHRRPLRPGRDPHPARRRRDARVRAAQRRLCLELGDLPVLDGRHLARCC